MVSQVQNCLHSCGQCRFVVQQWQYESVFAILVEDFMFPEKKCWKNIM